MCNDNGAIFDDIFDISLKEISFQKDLEFPSQSSKNGDISSNISLEIAFLGDRRYNKELPIYHPQALLLVCLRGKPSSVSVVAWQLLCTPTEYLNLSTPPSFPLAGHKADFVRQ